MEYAVGLSAPKIINVDGNTFSSKPIHRIEEKLVSVLNITTLTGLVDYIKTNRDELDIAETIIQITDTASVRFISIPNKDRNRECYVEAAAVLPVIRFGGWYDLEDFNILLQSSFEQTEDRDLLLKYVSNISDDSSVKTLDDGTTQQVTAKTGITTVANVRLPNPATLKPYRTFQEVEQVESEFIFRIRKDNKGVECALFEADGGAWKIKCRSVVKEYLNQALDGVDSIVIIG